MEITKHNFEEELDNVVSDIKECTFMAIDGEFTGLDSVNFGHAAPFDTPSERYQKIRNGSTDFLLIQVGLCTFKVDQEKQKYEAKPYNFYIFPRPYSRQSPDRRFMCQSSSIDFLIAQGFDFNKLFKEGIPYLTPEQETKLHAELDRKHEEINKLSSPGLTSPDGGSSRKGNVIVPEEQKPFLDEICKQVATYLDGEDIEPLTFPPCNGFQRKLVYQTVQEKFPLAHLQTLTGTKKERYIVVSRMKDAEELHKKALDKQTLEKLEIDLQVGFSKVIRAITESGKLVVGHNMFLDVIHCISHFHCQLPQNLNEYKTLVKAVFPRLLDTKLMANTHPFKEHIPNSSLDELRQTLLHFPFKPVKVELPERFSAYSDGGGAFHEAGYDAFVTGSCFAHMTKFLGTFQNPHIDFMMPTSHVIEPFVNKLFLMRINDIPYMNLDGPDLEPSRDHIFHVTFPREWRVSDLHQMFHPYGNIQISWLTETSAYVALYKKENAQIALTALSQDGNPFNVVSYAWHRRSKEMHWTASTPASHPVVTPPSVLQKRKILHADVELPPSKVQRRSLTSVSSHYPSIPEEETEKGDVDNTNNHSSSSSDSKTTPGSSKLFEESAQW